MLNFQTLKTYEMDSISCLVSEMSFRPFCQGQPVKNKLGQYLTIVGVSKGKDNNMEAYKHPVVDQSIDSSYDACKCVYIDNAQPERQEIVSDRLQELTPLIDLNPEHTQAAANCSLFYESGIVKHLLKIYGE